MCAVGLGPLGFCSIFMRPQLVNRLFLALLACVAAASAASCSPGYVARGAYEQGKILIGRRDIPDVIQDPETPKDERAKLELVVSARSFAEGIGLTPRGSFTTYSDIGKDTLSWIVVGARKDSFSLYTWWFPIVGRVPYKGFFDQKDANDQARQLEAEGFETWVRGTDAFSTLGWFNDPVLSTTLRNPPVRVANTVIHESVHSTIWIPGSVPFNESLANFIAMMATEQFFVGRAAACKAEAGRDCSSEDSMLADARRDASVQYDLGHEVQGMYAALEELYTDKQLSSEQKIPRRGVIFAEHVTPLRTKYPQLKALQQVNNAEIMQLKIYLTDLDLFRVLFAQVKGDWSDFLSKMEEIKSQRNGDESLDPFVLLREKVKGNV